MNWNPDRLHEDLRAICTDLSVVIDLMSGWSIFQFRQSVLLHLNV